MLLGGKVGGPVSGPVNGPVSGPSSGPVSGPVSSKRFGQLEPSEQWGWGGASNSNKASEFDWSGRLWPANIGVKAFQQQTSRRQKISTFVCIRFSPKTKTKSMKDYPPIQNKYISLGAKHVKYNFLIIFGSSRLSGSMKHTKVTKLIISLIFEPRCYFEKSFVPSQWEGIEKVCHSS